MNLNRISRRAALLSTLALLGVVATGFGPSEALARQSLILKICAFGRTSAEAHAPTPTEAAFAEPRTCSERQITTPRHVFVFRNVTERCGEFDFNPATGANIDVFDDRCDIHN